MNTRNRLIRVSVEFPEAKVTTTKYYREGDLAALRAPVDVLGGEVLAMIGRIQEVTANDPET